MGFEIDYLPVGEKPDDKCGDAIAMRFWDVTPDDSFVMTIDGGTRDSGAALTDHIKKYYKTSKIDVALLTHPDGDHASGLRDILEQMSVGVLLALIPWEHANDILPIVQRADSRATAQSIERRLKDAFSATVEAVEFARQNGVRVVEPVCQGGPLTQTTQAYVLGPTLQAYLTQWLPNYDCLPHQVGLLQMAVRRAAGTIKWIGETWDKESLLDPGQDEVSAENNSSVILAVSQEKQRFLFCGDAGVPALTAALAIASANGLSADGFSFFHVPHHGSRHNLGPSLLNTMFGLAKATPDNVSKAAAFVSATKGDPKHPSRRLTNALNRRGVRVVATDGIAKYQYSNDSPARPGWRPVEPILFSNTVEDIED